MNEPEQIQQALEYTSRKIGNPNIYTMISGHLTPKKHEIAKRRCTINSDEYTNLLHFLQQNHLSYSHVEREETNPQQVYFPCTSPNILENVTELLEKCPTAATSMDCDGRAPLHHLL